MVNEIDQLLLSVPGILARLEVALAAAFYLIYDKQLLSTWHTSRQVKGQASADVRGIQRRCYLNRGLRILKSLRGSSINEIR